MADSLDNLEDGGTLDLGLIDTAIDEVIEMNKSGGPDLSISLLNHITYNVSVVHELDGLYDELITVPEMAVEKAAGILWVLMTSGFFHRIRVEATDDRQFYHIRLCEATMVYQGQLS